MAEEKAETLNAEMNDERRLVGSLAPPRKINAENRNPEIQMGGAKRS
jgi:hypothetical protein